MITFTPPDDFAALLERAKCDIEVWRKARGENKEPPWAQWAGERLERMKRRRAVTSMNLNSADPDLRLAATAVVAEYWLAGQRFAADVLRMAFDDPQPAIRGAALTALQLNAQHVVDPTRMLRKLLAELFPRQPATTSFARFTAERIGQLIRKLLGEERHADAERMLASRGDAESYLLAADPKFRCAALLALKNCWECDERFGSLCERLAFDDPDVEVRSLALSCLAGFYAAADNTRVERLIAWIVYDSREPRKIRVSAYQSLFIIRRMSLLRGARDALSEAFRVPEDIDWAFVNSFFHVKQKSAFPFF
jgi:hypothetical protein